MGHAGDFLTRESFPHTGGTFDTNTNYPFTSLITPARDHIFSIRAEGNRFQIAIMGHAGDFHPGCGFPYTRGAIITSRYDKFSIRAEGDGEHSTIMGHA